MQRITAGLLLAALSISANADNFDYSYFSLGYGMVELDDVDADGDGFGFDGSLALSNNFHLFADYEMAEFDFGVDSTAWGAGVGYNMPISPMVDFVARVSYEYVEVDAPGFGSADENGLGLGFSGRFHASEQLELTAGIDYLDFGDSGDETAIGLGGLYSFSSAFALGLGGNWSDDASAYTVSGRFYFDK